MGEEYPPSNPARNEETRIQNSTLQTGPPHPYRATVHDNQNEVLDPIELLKVPWVSNQLRLDTGSGYGFYRAAGYILFALIVASKHGLTDWRCLNES